MYVVYLISFWGKFGLVECKPLGSVVKFEDLGRVLENFKKECPELPSDLEKANNLLG